MDWLRVLVRGFVLLHLWTLEAGGIPAGPASTATAAELQQTPMQDGRRIWKFLNPISWLPPFYFQMGNRQYGQRPSGYAQDSYYGYGHGGGGGGYGGGYGYGMGEGKKEKEKEKEKKPKPEPEPEKPKEMPPPEDHPVYNYYNVQNINSYYSTHGGDGCGCEYKRNCDCEYGDEEYEYVDR